MLLPIAVAALVGLYLATKNKAPKGTPGNLLPTPENIPKIDSSAKPVVAPDAIKPELRKSVVNMGPNRGDRSYTATVFNTTSRGKQFVIVQLNETTAWMSYYQIGTNKPPVRKLVKAFAKGDRDQSGRVVSVMMSDFGVKK